MRACKNCKRLILSEKVLECPYCKTSDLTHEFEGVLIIIDKEKTQLKEIKGELEEGMFVIEVR